MLKRLEVKHFKSLDDFAIDFEPFTVLIGQNGSGKTTVLQALDLLGAFLKGDVNHYLERLGWDVWDLRSVTTRLQTIRFRLEFEAKADTFVWDVEFLLTGSGFEVITETIFSKKSHFKYEVHYNANFPSFEAWELINADGKPIDLPGIAIQFKQSIIKAFQIQNAPEEIEKAAHALERLFLLDIDSTERLRKPAKYKAVDNIGSRGEHLASFLRGLNVEQQRKLLESIKRLIPQIQQVNTLQAGETIWLSFLETFSGSPYPLKEIEASHISNGTLQILAILATIHGAIEGQILLLDEIENGIDPNHVSIMVQLLEEAIEKKGIQVILATHSPVILNYVSEAGIRYFSRDKGGNTIAKNPFDRQELKEMLEYMNPGEVWLNLSEEELKGGQ